MSQTLLFAIGVGVFTITLCATLLHGFSTFGQMYEAAVEEEADPSPPDQLPVREGPSLTAALTGLDVTVMSAEGDPRRG